MKRKKFVKQLMSLGLDRNKANEMAVHVQRGKGDYTGGLELYKRILDEITKSMRKEFENAVLYGYGPLRLDFKQTEPATFYRPLLWHDCRIAPAAGIVNIKAVEQ